MSRIANRRLAVLALLLAGLVGTGVWSLATVTDSLTVTNNLSVLSVDIQASKDGTTFSQSLTQPVLLQSGSATAAVIDVKNAGNGSATLTYSATGTGASSITAGTYDLWMVANAAACTTTPVGTKISSTVSTVASSTSNAVVVTIAPGANQWLCEVFGAGTPASTDTATQTLTFTATASLSGTQ